MEPLIISEVMKLYNKFNAEQIAISDLVIKYGGTVDNTLQDSVFITIPKENRFEFERELHKIKDK